MPAVVLGDSGALLLRGSQGSEDIHPRFSTARPWKSMVGSDFFQFPYWNHQLFSSFLWDIRSFKRRFLTVKHLSGAQVGERFHDGSSMTGSVRHLSSWRSVEMILPVWETNMAGWNIPMFKRKYIFISGPFSMAILDYRSVHDFENDGVWFGVAICFPR